MSQTAPAAAAVKPTPISYWIHVAICLFITFGFGKLPPFGPVTPLGMNIIGIFLGVLYGWIFIEIVWPSLMGLLALMLIGGMKPVDVFHRSLGDPIVQMTFLSSFFALLSNTTVFQNSCPCGLSHASLFAANHGFSLMYFCVQFLFLLGLHQLLLQLSSGGLSYTEFVKHVGLKKAKGIQQ